MSRNFYQGLSTLSSTVRPGKGGGLPGSAKPAECRSYMARPSRQAVMAQGPGAPECLIPEISFIKLIRGNFTTSHADQPGLGQVRDYQMARHMVEDRDS
eukprot:100788-Hanusia_phi.AAC.1